MQFERLPSILPLYWRALRDQRRSAEAARPLLNARVSGFVPDGRRLQRFRAVVAQPDDGQLPPTYPQVLAAPLHLALLTDPVFPFRAAGLVHVANRIDVRRHVAATERIALQVGVRSYTDTARGCEVELHTQLKDKSGETAWSATAIVLARTPARGSVSARRAMPRATAATDHVASWTADAGIGRRYARVSGDYNPIHLSALSARLFGFDRAIAHGMWTLARVLAALHPLAPPPLSVDVAFRRPLLLPAQTSLFAAAGDCHEFVLRDNRSSKAILQGSLKCDARAGET